MSHLARVGPVYDENGMASATLAREVGYPGSSVAFAQLLSGMERSGLIERDVRGKRTYRISTTPDAAASAQASAGGGRSAEDGTGTDAITAQTAGHTAQTGGHTGEAAGHTGEAASGDGDALGAGRSAGQSGDFDYDELARRLLVEVVRRLASAPVEATPSPAAVPADDTALEQTVAGLEQELASVRTMHGTLTEENARLRRQLQAARHSLALARRSAGQPVADQLDAAEVTLLERLLAHSAETRTEDTG
ncbi:MAG TPA: hypothetical protein VGH27_30385 [Streptosporangiaceae bacterium]